MLLRPHTFFLGPQLSEQRSRQPSDGIAFLQVLDFDTNENVQVQIIGDIRKLLNEANEGPNLSKRITDLTNHLPNQAQGVVRLYIEQDCDKNYTYLTHLHSVLKDFPLTGYCSDVSRGFEAAAAQWSGTAHSSWCRAWSFGFSSFSNIQKLQEEKGLNFRRLLGIGDTFTDETMSMARASARALSTNLTRKVRQMCVLENHQEELVKIVFTQPCLDFKLSQTRKVDSLQCSYPARIMDKLWNHYAPLTYGGSQILQKKLLVLWYHHAHLVELSEFIRVMRSLYFRGRQRLFDSRNSSLAKDLMEEMTYDIGFYQELESSIKNLTLLIESLSSSIEATFNRQEKNDGQEYLVDQFKELMADIRGVCADTLNKTTDMSASMDNQMKLLELRREIEQSSSLWILSVLASIFLPLSLASGVLSMGTRFNDLGPILYDFCGVTVLLMALAFIILVVTRQLMRLTEVIESLRSSSNRVVQRLWTIFLIGMMLLGWGMVLSSFIVGMLEDIKLGVRILGFGILCLLGLTIIGGTGMRSVGGFIDVLQRRYGEVESLRQPPI
ncbi:hypothetical protein G7054_g3288 [Neopestalotiopsis clavispora]|nr:hypothetical protein G7054_g3288 [Neopestalotiopsis clavispora]